MKITQQRTIRNYRINVFTQGDTPNLLMVESLITGESDYPIVYASGLIAYDRPEIWPQYLKNALTKFVQRLLMED